MAGRTAWRNAQCRAHLEGKLEGKPRVHRSTTSGACWLTIALLSMTALGCAGPLRRVTADGVSLYEHQERGYRIRDAATSPGSRWQRVDVEGADLAYVEASGSTNGGGSSMTLIAECRGTPGDPMILARHLVIGIEPRRLRAAAPAVVAGVSAWSQTFDAEIEGVPVRVKTLTAAPERCSYDWVMVATHDFERLEREFDSWWRSFRLGVGGNVSDIMVQGPPDALSDGDGPRESLE